MKRSTMYRLRKHNVDENLINYMQMEIYPIYEHGNIDAGHRMPHIETVIDRSITFAEECEQNGMDIDYNMVYTIASYHDVGLSQAPRETHEQKSAEMFRKDDYLKSYFSSDKFDTIAEAIEEHRASLQGEPKTVYGKIVSQADRCYNDFSDYLVRCYHYRENDPSLDTMEKLSMNAYEHLNEKFGRNGYAYSKAWFKDENLERFKKEALDLLEQPPKDFTKDFEQIVMNKLKAKENARGEQAENMMTELGLDITDTENIKDSEKDNP